MTQAANGGIAPVTGFVDSGSTPTYTITPNANYHISTITANGAPVAVTAPAGQSYTFAPVSGAGSLTASFSANTVTQYTITVTQTANGGITPVTGYVDAGSTPTYTITPDSGYHIATITANGVPVTVTTPAGQSYTFAAVAGDGSLTATYAANGGTQYTVTVTQTGHGMIAPGTSSYDAGSTPEFYDYAGSGLSYCECDD